MHHPVCNRRHESEAEQVWRMVQDKILNAVSVGFLPRTIRHEMRDGKEVYVLADNELHEISVVPIPANPEALAKMKAKARAEAETKGSNMDLEKLKAALEDERKARAALEAELATLKSAAVASVTVLAESIEPPERAERDLARAERDAARAERDAATKAAEKAATERDASRKEADDLRGQLTDKEVETLVGVKILPAEKDAMAALAKKDRASFDALVAARPELSLLSQVIENPTKAVAPPSADAAQELAALAMREGV
jgi:hypothetical protein